ncbi:MAG: single-stranded DNA-binding protein [Oscillospiraceae bacterium]|nr:single-stranded DNA-binding protein [Oscillospiraceae bacterium]
MNKAILMGRLTRDPEVRYSQSNLAVCNYTLAIDRRFPRQGEENQADFIPIVTFGKTAEFCEKYFRKGQQVAVVGRIQTRTWDDNEGKRHYMTEVIADECFFADSKRPDGGGGGNVRPEDYGYYPHMDPSAPTQTLGTQSSGAGASSEALGYGANNAMKTGRENSDSGLDDGFSPVENENDLPF